MAPVEEAKVDEPTPTPAENNVDSTTVNSSEADEKVDAPAAEVAAAEEPKEAEAKENNVSPVETEETKTSPVTDESKIESLGNLLD